jgi:hypothetical protein
MHKPVKVAHSSFIEGLHTTKNMASAYYGICNLQILSVFIVHAPRLLTAYEWPSLINHASSQGILKGEVSLYF